jgi:hypothetical protein
MQVAHGGDADGSLRFTAIGLGDHAYLHRAQP